MKKDFLVFLHRKVLFLSCEAFYGACIFWKHVGIIYTVTFNLSLDYILDSRKRDDEVSSRLAATS